MYESLKNKTKEKLSSIIVSIYESLKKKSDEKLSSIIVSMFESLINKTKEKFFIHYCAYVWKLFKKWKHFHTLILHMYDISEKTSKWNCYVYIWNLKDKSKWKLHIFIMPMFES